MSFVINGLNNLFLFSFAKVLWDFEMIFHSLIFPVLPSIIAILCLYSIMSLTT